MEEIREGRPNFTFFNSEIEEEAQSSFFLELKTYCLDLLNIFQNPKNNTSSLSPLHDFLCRCPPDALQPFFDYALFPLLLLLDAAVECRSSRKVNAKPDYVMSNVLKAPPDVSDVVAEGVLKCLEELLKKCHLGSVDQMVVLLKKLTFGAILSPSEAAEEFREGIIKCFRALLLNLCLCSDESCSCKQINGLPALSEDRDWRSPLSRLAKNNLELEGCLLAFLQSQSASAAVGHWLSLLLKAADVEAARGHRGSAKLRIESFLTLRILVAKVGTADALAFFLPGVVSQFAKVLHVSKTMISGASGRVEAIDQAIRGLAEFLMIVLQDDANLSSVGLSLDAFSGFQSNKDKSPLSFLEELRHLPVKSQSQNEVLMEDSSSGPLKEASAVSFKEKEGAASGNLIGSFHVNRTKDWIVKTAAHVDKLLSATFPHFCVHPAKKVRRGLLVAIRGLLSKCSYTLKESRMMLLECLCVLVCDDSEEVSKDAQVFLGYLLDGNHLVKNDLSEIFSRLVEKLPTMVLGSEESLALSHAKKLLVVIYFSGPRLVVDHLFQSPVTTARFLDVFALCLSQNSVFAGSLDKLILARPSSTGYLPSISEIKAGICIPNDDHTIMETVTLEDLNISSNQCKRILHPAGNVQKEYELPRMPPWFAYVGSQKLYEALAWILRLVGLSLMTDSKNGGSLSVITDIPLGYFRNLVSEVRMREYGAESWQSWYNRTGSGQLVRKASTAACILNEIIYGISDQAAGDLDMMFQNSSIRWEQIETCQHEHSVPNKSIWKVCQESGARCQLIDCIGSILHEYQSPEVWDIPIEHRSYLHLPHSEVEDVSLHFFRDNIMLREVIIHGIGIFNMCLGKEFSSCGFLHSSLYVLLENLSCSNFHIRSACDAVLHVISSTSGYPTVGHLVLANSDYVIDSICRQLRHLDLNPHAPNVLASMLSYIGVAHKILPLLEEPMRAVSVELEILGRHQHPDLTIPFLKAVAEIAKASKCEACSLPTQAVSYSQDVKSKLSALEKKAGMDSRCSTLCDDRDIDTSPLESEPEVLTYSNDDEMAMEQWEEILFKLNDSKRYRQIVGSVVNSCLTAATPLLASEQLGACLVALDIVEYGILALAKVEEAYKQEKETKEAIERVFELCSYHNFKDTLDSTEDGTNENRLLPAVNKIWPFLVACVRNKNPVAVRRCSGVVSNVVHICGGDFFSRRFHVDGPHFWKLLSTSPFQKKPISKEERTPLQLPYRSTSTSSENPIAEVSSLKVQVAVLNMIAELSRNKRSASALEAVLKKVSGLVVGVACSSVSGLRDASVEALIGLASMDPDLIWLLLADVYYSLKKKDMPLPPTSEFPEISEILPPPLVPKGYLYVQYGGQSYGFDIDFSSVETVFKRLHSEVFGSQMYS